MKINLDRFKQINWVGAAKKNRYSLISVLVLIVYFYAIFLAISFIATNVRDAFAIDQNMIVGQIVTFDLESYGKISRRFDK